MDFGVARVLYDAHCLVRLLAGLAHQQHRIALVLHELTDCRLQFRELDMACRRKMTLREILGGTQVDDHGIAPVDQLGGFGSGKTAAATTADRRPQEQSTGNEGNRDEYKVCVIGEKLHGKSAGKERNRKGQSSHYKITV